MKTEEWPGIESGLPDWDRSGVIDVRMSLAAVRGTTAEHPSADSLNGFPSLRSNR